MLKAKIDKEFVFCSVDATEHSVMCSYGTEGELESLKHLMTNVTPKGIISIVSDTWDFWKLVTEYVPALKDTIMNREGTVVIRPDSGDPVKIVCGDPNAQTEHEQKGLIECLWGTFGGTEVEWNGKQYKLLDNHIGAIYGDSITLDRQKQIHVQLMTKGFVPSVVLGIGSFTYQYVTRDTRSQPQETMHYPVTIERDGDSWMARFQDVPEALTSGDTREEALAEALDALVTAFEFYFEDSRPVPLPSAPADGQEVVTVPPSLWAKVLLLNAMCESSVNQAELGRRLGIPRQNKKNKDC